ncbi:HTH-type transcriptional repressor ComR [Labrenzia sp. THAF82]|uniref:TetR/AcrR family transcriptional regulator n=1 Tax=Labrenzia sp. THAF82 TaxID=2587861 RepID=UPI001268D49D|nr:TetR/AcrR family transcriptional regulator [Labrenzia sp. THAF82]QFT29725.1 HTH-type transcriptional repressor ComR [Labrenzia sp. THAF82]
MARPKGYDPEEIVKRATHAFWQHGYQALGVRELERLTGLNQFALRSEFGGKEGLYLAALNFYSEQAISIAMEPMRDGGGVPEIIAFLRSLITDGSMTSSPHGCLVVNTGIENARVGSADLDKAARHYWNALEKCFEACLQNAIDAEKISSSIDAKTYAKGLVSAVMGVHAQNRLEGKNTGGRHLVDLLCKQLTSLETS